MFRIAKYYMLIGLYKRAKKNIVSIVMAILVMIFTSYLFADIIALSGEKYSYGFLVLKWFILLSAMIVIVVNIRKVMKIASRPFSSEVIEPAIDTRKEKILAKEKIMTRSDLIMEKYRSSK